jgi:CRISPR-associated protein Cas5t
MLCLYLEAPFAAFRTFTAGSFRPTAEFITPSAAYGLLLNVAGIEMRQHKDQLPMTTIKPGLPRFSLALGALRFPQKHTVYQQLHNYPVGAEAGQKYKGGAKGNKYNITPTRRAFLSDLKGYICIKAPMELEDGIKNGLNGNSARTYGLPFLGDNNFLLSKLEPVENPEAAFWFERLLSEPPNSTPSNVTRLTVAIDREDMSGTRSFLFAPTKEPSRTIPENAWVEVGY